jgi:hypothetical protein
MRPRGRRRHERTRIRGVSDSHPLVDGGKARHDRMVGLAWTMLRLHKDLPKAKTPHKQESLKRTIEATDAQIDALVYELCGMMEGEIRIIEGGLK